MMHYTRGLVTVFLITMAFVFTGSSGLHATVHEIHVGNFYFTPQATVVNPGDTVRWILDDGVHTATSTGDSPKAWDSGTMNSPGQTFEVQFTAGDGPGPFPYLCSIHPTTMQDTIYMTSTCFGGGDLDDDGDALTNDDFSLLTDFLNGQTGPFAAPSQADLNGDCLINAADQLLFEEFLSLGFAVFEPFGGYPVATCCDPAYDISPDTIVIFGMEHVSEGLASLDSSGGQLIVSNIHASGLDGYTVDLGSSQSFGVRSVFPEDDSLPAGTADSTTIFVRSGGGDPVYGWNYIKKKKVEGSYDFSLNFNENVLPDSMFHVELRNNGKKVDDLNLETVECAVGRFEDAKAAGDPLDCDDDYIILPPEMRLSVSSRWDQDVIITFPGEDPDTVDQMIITSMARLPDNTVMSRDARKGRNPQTGKEIKIPASYKGETDNIIFQGFATFSHGLGEISGGPNGDSLHITGMGSSGLDGFSVDLGRCKGGPIRWMAPEALTHKTYSSIYVDRTGMQDVRAGDVNTEWFVDSGYLYADFSPLGDTIYEVKIYNSSGDENPLHTGQHNSGRNILYSPGQKGPGQDPFDGHGIDLGKPKLSVEFREVVDIDLNDGSGVHQGDRIEFVIQGNESDLEFLRRLRCFVSGTDSIILHNLGVFVFGPTPISGAGQIEITPLGDSILLGNIGSSGDDAIISKHDAKREFSIGFGGMSSSPLPGAYMQLDLTGSKDSVEGLPLASVKVEKSDAGWQTSANYAPIGSEQQLMQVFMDDSLLKEGTIGNALKAQHDASMNSIRNIKGSIITEALWDQATMITIPGEASVMGNKLVITSLNPASTVDHFSEAELKLKDMPDMVLTDFSASDGYVCGDANSDGNVNVSDAVYIINFVFAGGTTPDPLDAADPNCDGDVNVSDAVWIINFVFSGGNDPCDSDGDGIPDC